MPRKHLDNYTTTLNGAVIAGASSVVVVDDPGALAAGEYFEATIVDNPAAPTKMDRVRVTANAAGTLTITPALTNGYDSGATLGAWNCKALFDLIDGAELADYFERVNMSAGATLDRSTGGYQHLALTDNETLDLTALTAGKAVMYTVTGGDTFTLGFTGLGRWATNVSPTLKATHYLGFVHDGSEVVGYDCGGG